MRRQALSITWTPGVRPDEAQVMIQTIQEAFSLLRGSMGPKGQYDPLPSLRVFGAWMIPAVPKGAAYWGIQWYVDNSLDADEDTLIGSRYLQMISMEPWQSQDPHFDLVMTDRALLDDQRDDPGETLGVTRNGMASVVSMNMLRSIDDSRLRMLALRQMVAHYFGRMAGAPRFGLRDDVSLYEGMPSCNNMCAMRSVNSARQALMYGQEQNAAKVLYCGPCQLDLIALLTGFHYGLN